MGNNRLLVRKRAFTIWQKAGLLPWSKPKERKEKGDFYKGAFSSIPFLNDDAKRTFVHLLLRPGYMIRDYINGQHERYLAPLTSLIIFYAFFALISSIVHPDFSTYDRTGQRTDPVIEADSLGRADDSDSLTVNINGHRSFQISAGTVKELSSALLIWELDRHPEMVDTPVKASIAALESSLRSQGVYLFLGNFLFLWLAMCLILKKKEMSVSACAAIAAYVLCQFCFFMFFSLFLSSGHKGEIGAGLMGVLLTIDYHQLFDLGWKKSIRLTVKTGIFYVLTIIALSILIAILVFFFYLFLK